MRTSTKFDKYPKFIIGKNLDASRWFIIHTQYPKFIGEFIDNSMQPDFLDDISGLSAEECARIMREAGDAFAEYINNAEED